MESLPVRVNTVYNQVATLNLTLPICCFSQPITLALVYVGTTLKDLSDVTHGWHEFSTTRWVRAVHSYPYYNLYVVNGSWLGSADASLFMFVFCCTDISSLVYVDAGFSYTRRGSLWYVVITL